MLLRECIPVGCVPAARRPYGAVCSGGRGEGSAPGVGCIPACTEADTLPPPTVDRILDTRLWKYYLGPTSLRPVIMGPLDLNLWMHLSHLLRCKGRNMLPLVFPTEALKVTDFQMLCLPQHMFLFWTLFFSVPWVQCTEGFGPEVNMAYFQLMLFLLEKKHPLAKMVLQNVIVGSVYKSFYWRHIPTLDME